jgi:sugar phosphate isomerase/epimerase
MHTGKSVGIQMTLPIGYESDAEFIERLEALRDTGCDHVELNIAYPEKVEPTRIQGFLGNFGLRCTNYATGGLYPGKKTSLSHFDDKVRNESIASIKNVISYCSEAGFTGLILGFAQGNDTADRTLARKLFADSLAQLVPVALDAGVVIVVEALNRFISNVCNLIEDTVEMVSPYPRKAVAVLPDTYHMNIEEVDMALPLIKHASWFNSIHFSENNRYFPGLGAVDFQQVYRALESVGFSGTLTIEGNVKHSFIPELQGSVGLIKLLELNENLYAGRA